MSNLDWMIMVGTIATIVLVGWWKNRHIKNIEGYFRGDNELKWQTIGLSIMATQASAITFLSTPGQAYVDGMRFVQFYFGLPLAMILISAVFVPFYYRLRVYTAYEYLESRFDVKVRVFGAFLFLVQRGLATGITIYAPAIILSAVLGWPLSWMVMIIGAVVILYTVSGGTKAVSQTQKQQMIVIMVGMITAAVIIFMKLPKGMSLGDVSALAGSIGRMNVLDFSFDPNNRYNFWSGLIGGFFLQLAYFGTDQSQVQRYLSGRSVTESRLGLLFNGLFKIPMQFVILFIGIMLLVFYMFVQPPIFFNTPALAQLKKTHKTQLAKLEARYNKAFAVQKSAAHSLLKARKGTDAAAIERAKVALKNAHTQVHKIRTSVKSLLKKALPKVERKDSDYIFITFVISHLPVGLIGLLIAVILSAAMSSTASELNALGSTTTIDFYKRVFRQEASDRHYLIASKLFTVFWGLVAVAFATFASLLDNLIQAVNILGSIFYGTVLGIFLVAFFIKWVGSRAVLAGALVAQVGVIMLFTFTKVGFLWYNLIGCLLVVCFAILFQMIPFFQDPAEQPA
ncbi:MAG TPA: sodium:solute symporter [Myxococcales bacterium]|nr:sodium:solute symporter [Deltaproteobacteria bacterium]MBU49196.1 sodium:solute symporter [Deltaproteobacteria bacterium]HAA53570.1 sodium:solute symporter [Myxococcales bacterium]